MVFTLQLNTTDTNNIGKKMLRITDIDSYNKAKFLNLPYCTRFVKGDHFKLLRKE